MTLMISPSIKDSLIIQWQHEMENRSVYLFISSFLANKGLGNLAKKFKLQADEELEHADMIYKYVVDMGGDFIPTSISGFSFIVNSILDIAILYKEKEISTTQSLQDLLDLAIEVKDSISEVFIRKMIKLQKHEYEEVSDFEDKALIIGDDWKTAFLWDVSHAN
jgi:ferritin